MALMMMMRIRPARYVWRDHFLRFHLFLSTSRPIRPSNPTRYIAIKRKEITKMNGCEPQVVLIIMWLPACTIVKEIRMILILPTLAPTTDWPYTLSPTFICVKFLKKESRNNHIGTFSNSSSRSQNWSRCIDGFKRWNPSPKEGISMKARRKLALTDWLDHTNAWGNFSRIFRLWGWRHCPRLERYQTSTFDFFVSLLFETKFIFSPRHTRRLIDFVLSRRPQNNNND
jgi:hypothetical protein